jgi:hypothetical protein
MLQSVSVKGNARSVYQEVAHDIVQLSPTKCPPLPKATGCSAAECWASHPHRPTQSHVSQKQGDIE